MKKPSFSVEQIVSILKQAELGLPVADLIRHVGISKQTFYRWKKQYADLESDQVRELKQVLEENVRLKKTVAAPASRRSNKKSKVSRIYQRRDTVAFNAL